MPAFRYVTVDGSAHLLAQWLELRTRVYLDEGLIDGSELDRRGRYVDAYDACSEHVLVLDEGVRGEPIGTVRLIDGRRTRLQVTDDIGVVPGGDALQVSGLALLPAYRTGFAALGAYRLVFDRACRGGYDELHFETELAARDTLRWLGVPLCQTGPERFAHHAVNVPLMVRVHGLLDALRAADAARADGLRVGDLFAAPFDGRLDTRDLFVRAPRRRHRPRRLTEACMHR